MSFGLSSYPTERQRAEHRSYASKNADDLAAAADRETELTFDPKYQVQATGFSAWPGENPLDAISRVRGELGSPHLTYLPILEDRGFAATLLARTICCLEGLSADGTAAGWRVRDGYSKESQMAQTTFASDINALADVVGRESIRGQQLKIQLLGPISLASSLRLANGERALSDFGARRDLRDSFCAGLSSWVRMLREAAPDDELVLQLNEPSLVPAARGEIPTSSGFRTLRSIPRHELEETYEVTVNCLREHFDTVLLADTDLPQLRKRGLTSALEPYDGFSYTLEKFSADVWESIATDIEAEKKVLLRTVNPSYRAGVGDLARQVWSSWKDVGLQTQQLSQLILTEHEGLERLDPAQATGLLEHLTDVARALAEIAQEN